MCRPTQMSDTVLRVKEYHLESDMPFYKWRVIAITLQVIFLFEAPNKKFLNNCFFLPKLNYSAKVVKIPSPRVGLGQYPAVRVWILREEAPNPRKISSEQVLFSPQSV